MKTVEVTVTPLDTYRMLEADMRRLLEGLHVYGEQLQSEVDAVAAQLARVREAIGRLEAFCGPAPQEAER